MPTGPAAQAREADDDVLRVVLLHLEEVPLVHDEVDQVEDVVRLVRRLGHQAVERLVLPVERVRRLAHRRVVHVVRREEAEQFADQQQALAVVGDGEVRDAAARVVRHRAAEVLFRDLLVGDGPDDVGTGHEHVARALHHHREVGDGRRVHRPAGARPHDRGDLRDDARRERVAEEDVRVAGERHDAFLDPRAARVVQPDDRAALAHGQVHDLHDLRGVGLGEGPAEHREVLREGVDHAPLDAPEARDDAVAGDHLVLHPEVAAAVRDQLVELLEGAGVEQQFHPLAGRQLALLVLAPHPRLAAPELRRLLQLRQLFVLVHRSPDRRRNSRPARQSGGAQPPTVPTGSRPGSSARRRRPPSP